MKSNVTFSIISLCLLLNGLHGQSLFLPYLSNGKYGVADEHGQLIIQPKYEAVITFQDRKLFQVKQNGLWGFINLKDEVILPIAMKDEQPKNKANFNSHGPSISFGIRKSPYDNRISPFEKVHLYSIFDGNAGVYYYVNPFVPLKSYTAFLDPKNVHKDMSEESSSAWTGLVKVGTLNKKINFIDTSGSLIFKSDIFNGDVMSPYIIAVENEKGMLALFDREQNEVTPFEFSSINSAKDFYFIIAEKKDSLNPYKKRYTLFDRWGNPLIENYAKEIRTEGIFAIVQDDSSYRLLDTTGNTIFENQEGAIRFLYKEKSNAFLIEKDGKNGVVDFEGKTILDPVYDRLSINYRQDWVFKLGETSGVMDSLFQVKWSVDSLEVEQRWPGSDVHFLLKRKVAAKTYLGVTDSLGRILLDPVYSHIDGGQEYFLVTKDSLYGLLDRQGKTILPLTDTVIFVNTATSHMTYHSREPAIIYNISTRERVNMINYPPVQVKKENGYSVLADVYNKAISPPIYKSLEAVQNLIIPRALFIASKEPGRKWKDMINESGKSIIPEGYSIFDEQNCCTIGGLVVVTNRADVEAIEKGALVYRYRSGIIDADGNWVINPDFMITKIIGMEFISTVHFEAKEFDLFDRFGQLLDNNRIVLINKLKGNRVLNDRLVVGVTTDSIVFQQLVEESYASTDIKEINSNFEKMRSIIVKGCIDHTGKEVVPFRYTEINEFEFPHTTVKGVDETGKLFTAIIDLDGKEMVRTTHAELKLLEKDSSLVKFKKGDYYGLMDLHGHVLIEPVYNDIQKDPWLGQFILIDSESTYVAPYHDPKQKTKIGPPGSVKFLKSTDFRYTILQANDDYSDKRYYYSFDQDGAPLQPFIGFGYSDSFMGRRLPVGFMGMSDSENGLPYVVNFRTGFKFKS